MNLHCANNWLSHLWGNDGKCLRCGVTGRTLDDVTSAHDPSRAASLSPTHPVDRPAQLDLPLDQPSQAGDSSFACVADNLVALVVP